MAERFDRRLSERPDQRGPAQRDRDRILYSSAFRRLAGVTQVVAADEGGFFHNRLTHSIKVAQLARRIAEHLQRGRGNNAWVLTLDPDVCEAAALAHDLGHPPFGHIGEEQLDALVVETGPADGFEGNAQSFRILTRLAQRHEGIAGLNLTRAVLDGVLKYPWLRTTRRQSAKKHRKYGAYESDSEYFAWARELHAPSDDARSMEAEIMDWADDVTYAVHDIEDFYRAGLVPVDRIVNEDYREAMLRALIQRWNRDDDRYPRIEPAEQEEARAALARLFAAAGPFDAIIEPYSGTREQRQRLRSTTAALVRRYLDALEVDTSGDVPILTREPRREMEVRILKQLAWHFVILSPALRTQQHGHIRIVRELFRIFSDAAKSEDHTLLPVMVSEALDEGVEPARAVADGIASLTEQQATLMWRRLTGVSSGTLASYPYP